MPGTTTKGVPYSLGADAASTIDDTMTLLAQWLDARPGIAIVTTAQRNALAAPDLWIGKVVYTTDTVGGARLEICTGLGPPATWRGVTISALVTDAQRDAFGVSDVWAGRTIYNTSSNTLQIYTGVGWAVVGPNIPSLTDTQRDALAGDDRWTGLLIWNTTSSTFQIWNGASWQIGTDITPAMTTAARTALAGDDLWLGRTVFDSTLEEFFIWDGAVWRPAVSIDTNAAHVAPLGPIALAPNAFAGAAPSDHVHGGLYGMRAAHTMTGGGTWAMDNAGNLSFSGRVMVIAEGNGADSATGGFFEIDQPAAATVCPVAGGAGARNWTAAGVQLGAWEALWYQLPIGSASASVSANFLVTAYTAAMEPPGPNYVLIAVRNGDTSTVHVMVGARPALSVPYGRHDAGDADGNLDFIRKLRQRVDAREVDLAYTSGALTTVTEKAGATTVKTTTLNYTSGQLTSVVETIGGRTITTTLNYTSGTLTSVTRAVA